MEILYTTSAIRNAIRKLFSDPKQRRVAIVAFVGADAEAFLPYPEGLELVCWPKVGGTNPIAIQNLINQKAKVRFSDNLHMKVYWAANKGAVITSANLSASALGKNGLSELGVLLSANEIDIKQILRQVQPYRVTKKKLSELAVATQRQNRALRHGGAQGVDFAAWHETGQQLPWKLGFSAGRANFCQEAIDISRQRYGVKQPTSMITCGKGDYNDGDCLLGFYVSQKHRVSEITWMPVDFIVRDQEAGRGAYQAVQVHSCKLYPVPFAITPRFKVAFKKALAKFGIAKIENVRTMVPPKRLIDLIAEHYKAGK